MNIMKQLRDELAKKLAQEAANAAANSVDHCDPEAKRVIEKTVEARAKKLLDPDDHDNPLPTDPDAPVIFRSDDKDQPFHIEVKWLNNAWKKYQNTKYLDAAIKDSMEIRAEWTFKF